MKALKKGFSAVVPFYTQITAAFLVLVGFVTVFFYTNSAKAPRYSNDTVLGSSVAHAEVSYDAAGSAAGSGGGDSGSGCDSGGCGSG